MAAAKQTLGEFKGGILELVTAERPGLSKADVNAVLDAVVDQAQSDLANGYEVPLLGLAKLVPVVKKGRKKGTKVRNPFNKEVRTLAATEPDSIKVKAKPMAGAKSALPEAGSSFAKALIKDIG